MHRPQLPTSCSSNIFTAQFLTEMWVRCHILYTSSLPWGLVSCFINVTNKTLSSSIVVQNCTSAHPHTSLLQASRQNTPTYYRQFPSMIQSRVNVLIFSDACLSVCLWTWRRPDGKSRTVRVRTAGCHCTVATGTDIFWHVDIQLDSDHKGLTDSPLCKAITNASLCQTACSAQLRL